MNRVRSGVDKLDEILGGGLPEGSNTLIVGGPGTGKTILATQFILEGVNNGNENGLYVCFGETVSKLTRYLETLEFSIDPLIKDGKLHLMDLVGASRDELEVNMDLILDKAREFKAKRLVIDSISAMMLALEKKVEERSAIFFLRRFLDTLGCTSLLIAESPVSSSTLGTGVFEFVADGIISLDLYLDRNELKRRLVVRKIRGSGHKLRYYQFDIAPSKGIVILGAPTFYTPLAEG
jgi:KaiC/GvpD/RAD55 family RecA-like ATPase